MPQGEVFGADLGRPLGSEPGCPGAARMAELLDGSDLLARGSVRSSYARGATSGAARAEPPGSGGPVSDRSRA